jgi:hypothetical protein
MVQHPGLLRSTHTNTPHSDIHPDATDQALIVIYQQIIPKTRYTHGSDLLL